MTEARAPLPAAPLAEVSGDEAILSFIFGRAGEIQEVVAAAASAPPRADAAPAAAAGAAAAAAAAFAAEERRARALAEAGELAQALAALDAVVRDSEALGGGSGGDGVRLSALNDRAQVRRLVGDDGGAMVDLDRAVALAERRGGEGGGGGGSSERGDAGCAAVLAQALMQRSVLRHQRGGAGADEDLRRAAALGHPLAGRAAGGSVGGNAMATLCRDTVQLMMKAAADSSL